MNKNTRTATQKEMDAVFYPFKTRGLTLKDFRKARNGKPIREYKNKQIYTLLLWEETNLSYESIAKHLLTSPTNVQRFISYIRNNKDIHPYVNCLRNEIHEQLGYK